jgi:drug/metabolite transporter (DMT)-like permease
MDARWVEGVLFGITGAAVFACALWITDHRLSKLPGTVRSMLTMAVVFISSALAGVAGWLPGGMDLPTANAGWIALACLILLYGMAFSTLFILVTRLDIARNAPVMNMEPVAGLVFGWLILGQLLNGVQVIGGVIVVGGIVMLAMRKTR